MYQHRKCGNLNSEFHNRVVCQEYYTISLHNHHVCRYTRVRMSGKRHPSSISLHEHELFINNNIAPHYPHPLYKAVLG